MKILVDYDDVLVSCNQYALTDINKRHNTNFELEDIVCWGKTNTLMDERIKYFENKDFVSSQPVLFGAAEFVSRLQQLGEVWICTAVHNNCINERTNHILSHFPSIDIEHIIIANDKSSIEADVRIDDKPENLDGKAAMKILWDQPWNRKCKAYKRAKQYSDIINYICNLSKGGVSIG